MPSSSSLSTLTLLFSATAQEELVVPKSIPKYFAIDRQNSILAGIICGLNQESILTLFAGVLLGWLAQRLTDIFSGPKIEMEIGSEARLLPNTGSEVKFLNIKVKNIKRNFLHRLLINSNTANNARAWVSFHDPITKGELLKINGRWTSTKEPVDYHGGVNIGDALVVSRETLPPNEETEISVAVKENQKKNVYAFNNESYLYSWKNQILNLKKKDI